MKYPAFNISEKSWKGKELELDAYILFDEFNYNNKYPNENIGVLTYCRESENFKMYCWEK
jgi:hypothetical protein